MSLRAFVLSVLFALPLLCLASTEAWAIKKPTCADPYDAVDSVWRWQQKNEDVRLDFASACFDPTGRTPEQRQQLAKRLVVVYDHEPAIIDMDRLKELKPDYVDPETREARVVPHERFPKIALERKGGKWLWSKSSLDWLDRYYVENLGGLDRAIERMPEWLKGELFDIAAWQYLALAALLGFGVLLRKALRILVGARLRKLAERIGQPRAASLVAVVASPGATLLVAILLRLSYPKLRLPADAALAMHVAVRLLITLSLVWAIYRAIDLLSVHIQAKAAKTDSRLDDQLVPLLRKGLKGVVVIAGALLVAQTMSVNVPSLLAGLGLGGLAFALAAKDTLANLFGSVTILLDGPFQIGDYVSIDGVDGTVEEVGLRSTRIRTFQDSLVVFPNAKLADCKIDNFQRRRQRRCLTTWRLAYDTSPEQIQAFVEGVRAIVRCNPHTRKDAYEVHMSGLSPDALEVIVQFFLTVDSWSEELRQKHNMFLECLRLARDLGVRFAMPTHAVQVEQLAAAGATPPRAEPATATALAAIVEGYAPGGSRARPAGPIVTQGFLPTPTPEP